MALPSLRKCECSCPVQCRCRCSCLDHCSCLKDCNGNCYETLPTTRNLVVSIDGTSNQFGAYNTHVVELHSHVRKEDPARKQLTFYVSGIGTYTSPTVRKVISNTLDMAFARNFERQVQDAYRWLADNYQPGDRIFLFGFSRGAYQVRALAGMIEKMGLILPGNFSMIPFAYELYTQRLKGKISKDADDLCPHFKKTFSRKIGPVHFVGAWDTVASVGIIRGQPLPLTTSADHICHFRHALALDEHRVRFMPEYINGSCSQTCEPPQPSKNVESGNTTCTCMIGPQMKPHGNAAADEAKGLIQQQRSSTKADAAKPKRGDIKEVWFAGTHSDIGGGNRVNKELTLGRVPLLWMENEASSAGLCLEPQRGGGVWHWHQLKDEAPTESLTGGWRFLEILPFTRSTYNPEKPEQTKRWPPNNGRGRVVLPGQLVHASVAFKKGKDIDEPAANSNHKSEKLKKGKNGKSTNCKKYMPKASLLDSELTWESLVGVGNVEDISWAAAWHSRLEMDLFDSSTAERVGRELVDAQDEMIMRFLPRIPLLALTETGVSGLAAVRVEDRLIQLLQNQNIQDEKIDKALASTGLRLMLERRGSSLSDIVQKLEQFDFSFLLSTSLAGSDAKRQLSDLALLAACLEQKCTTGTKIADIWDKVLEFFFGNSRLENAGQASRCLGTFICIAEFVEALVNYADKAIGPIFPHLEQLFKDERPHVRRAATTSIGALAEKTGCHEELLPFVLQIGRLFKDAVWDVRETAVVTLKTLAEKSAFQDKIKDIIPQFREVLADEDEDVRRAAESALSKLAEKAVFHGAMKDLIPQIGKLFKEATWPVRQAAVISLGKFAEQGVFDEAIRTLVPEMKKLFKDDAWEVRQAVLVTIGELAKKPIFQGKIKDIVPQIGKLLKDTTWPVRYAAVATVDNLTENSIFHGRIKDIAPQFEQLLRDDTWDVRRAAVRTVAKFTKQTVSQEELKPIVAQIRALLAPDEIEDVRAAANDAIKTSDFLLGNFTPDFRSASQRAA